MDKNEVILQLLRMLIAAVNGITIGLIIETVKRKNKKMSALLSIVLIAGILLLYVFSFIF